MEIYQYLYDVSLPQDYGDLIKFHVHADAVDHDHHDRPLNKYTQDYYNSDIDKGDHVAVCVGKEWYRYPSSFYLRPWSRLYFLKSGFTGQLPQHYLEHEHGTRSHESVFNDNNAENPDHYMKLHDCHYLIDLDLGPGSENERDPRYTSIKHSSNWEIVHRVPFLNSAESPRLTRAFYLGPSQDAKNVYASYVLLKNTHPVHPHQSPSRFQKFETFELKDKYIKKRRIKRIREEKQKQHDDRNKQLHVPTLWPDIVQLPNQKKDIQNDGSKSVVVTTLPGKIGYWNRKIVSQNKHLIFVYGENHRGKYSKRTLFRKM